MQGRRNKYCGHLHYIQHYIQHTQPIPINFHLGNLFQSIKHKANLRRYFVDMYLHQIEVIDLGRSEGRLEAGDGSDDIWCVSRIIIISMIKWSPSWADDWKLLAHCFIARKHLLYIYFSLFKWHFAWSATVTPTKAVPQNGRSLYRKLIWIIHFLLTFRHLDSLTLAL